MKTSFLKTGAFVIGALIAMSGSAFKAERRAQVWAFKGNTEAEMFQAAHYELNGQSSNDCGETGQLPCVISVPNNITTQAQLNTYLSGKSKNEILELSADRRPVQE